VFRQTHRNWELLIVDDGSEDDTESVIAHFLHDSRVKYFRNKHRGVSNARNCGLEQAQGEYVFYLDSDNWWRRHYLRTMITFMRTRGLSASFSAIEAVNDDGVTQYFRGDRFDWDACFAQNYIDLNAFGHHRFEVQNHFKFDESLKRLVDWDFILTVTEKVKTAHAPFVGVWYYDGQDGRRITLHEDLGDQLGRTAQYIREKLRPSALLALSGPNDVRPYA
jgi:glycosyltransferase involved in cell wall biosynthesis